jgi:hypothetical protein
MSDSRWISINDGLPLAADDPCLATDGDRVDIVSYVDWARRWESWDSEGNCAVNLNRITHWMPLPELPTAALERREETGT